jgi:uncharacterized protein
MRVKRLENKIKNYFIIFASALLPLAGLLMLLSILHYFSTENIYKIIVTALMIILILYLLLVITGTILIPAIYHKRRITRPAAWLIRMISRFIMPVALLAAPLLRLEKDNVRRASIDLNNMVVESSKSKYAPSEVLVLLPHCLQNSECGYRITINLDNCRNCGKCSIGYIKELTRKLGVTVKVVTGGTAAREVVKKIKPRIILAVACERDLNSGISEVNNTPVVGILNERPYGPCFNTTVDIGVLEMKLRQILGEERSEEL